VDAVLQTNVISKPLVAAGGALIVVGLALVALIWANWELCVQAAKLAGAAQAATAAIGVVLVGLTLLYAGLRRTAMVVA
jgi:ACS family hexuronate transporter-like MFS transporter